MMINLDIQQNSWDMEYFVFVDNMYLVRMEPTKETPLQMVAENIQAVVEE